MNRRSFLVGTGGLALLVSHPLVGFGGEPAWHVLYPGSATREEAVELLDRIATQLGPEVAARLTIARRGSSFVVIYDRSHLRAASDRATAEAVARRHAEILRVELDQDGPIASVISSDELHETWNVRYGGPAPKEKLEKAWHEVARILGSGVAKALVIEDAGDGLSQLVYRRHGDRAGTEKVAAHHASLLRGVGIGAEAVRDAFAAVQFDGASATAASSPRASALVAQLDVPSAAAEVVDAGTDMADAAERSRGVGVLASDLRLRDRINQHVQRLRAQGRVSPVERTAWVVHDLVADETLCAINADVPMQAASMIKPFVAVAFFHQVQAGRLRYGNQSRTHMERMIRDSSNTSTNWLMQQVGGPKTVEAILRTHYPALTRGLRITEYIPSGGRTYLNKAAAYDHARLLRALWRDELPHAAELRRVMNLPGPDRLYVDVPEIPVGTEVYNKTGSTAMCCGDMGILVARTRRGERIPYILVGIIERSNRVSAYTSWMRSRGDVIRSVSGLTYRFMKERYGLV